MPIHLGGLGFRPYSRIINLAYVASFAQVIPYLGPYGSSNHDSTQHNQLSAALEKLEEQKMTVPRTVGAMFDAFSETGAPERYQHEQLSPVERAEMKQRLEKAGKWHEQRVKSATGK